LRTQSATYTRNDAFLPGALQTPTVQSSITHKRQKGWSGEDAGLTGIRSLASHFRPVATVFPAPPRPHLRPSPRRRRPARRRSLSPPPLSVTAAASTAALATPVASSAETPTLATLVSTAVVALTLIAQHSALRTQHAG
jgi:hypothetical protein